MGKAHGFCRQSAAPEHQLKVRQSVCCSSAFFAQNSVSSLPTVQAVYGRTGLIRFWDCCGAEDENAPGCCTSRHVTYDDPDD